MAGSETLSTANLSSQQLPGKRQGVLRACFTLRSLLINGHPSLAVGSSQVCLLLRVPQACAGLRESVGAKRKEPRSGGETGRGEFGKAQWLLKHTEQSQPWRRRPGHGTSTVHSSAVPHAPGRLEPASNLCEEGLKGLLADVVGAHLSDSRKTLGPSAA